MISCPYAKLTRRITPNTRPMPTAIRAKIAPRPIASTCTCRSTASRRNSLTRGTRRPCDRCPPRRRGSASGAARRLRARTSGRRAPPCAVRAARRGARRGRAPRSSCSVEKTRSTTVGARPSDGSSRSRIVGAATSARAIASCCCWPPESAPAGRCLDSSQTGNSSYSSARSSSTPLGARAGGEPEAAGSPRRSARRTAGVPPARARRRSGRSPPACGRGASGSPSVISPARAGTRPMIACSVVDLPAPFGPISPTISPGSTVNETSRTAATPP